jgi:alkylation response protein AidB-like acyl-CoA dehydrogenase
MSFPKTVRQAAIMELADQLAGPIAGRAEQVDRENRFPYENFQDLHRAGYLALTIPERYGGLGASPLEFALVQERLARACGSTALTAGMHLSLLGRIGETRLWPEETYGRVVRDVIERGALINAVNSEPDLGSPSRGALPSTTATRTPRGWRIDGRKRWASLAPALSWIFSLVTIIDGDAPPRRGNVLIPANLPGIRIEETWDNLGMRGTASHDMVFDGVDVPLDHMLPVEPAGSMSPANPWFVFPGAAVYLGIAQAARDAAVDFARSRRPNGLAGPIAELQTIQHKIAEIELDLFQARSILFDTAERWEARPAEREAMSWQLPAVKLLVTNAALRVTDLAMRVVGSAALSHRSPLQRYFRDARTALGHPPMEDAVLTLVGKTALGLLPERDAPAPPDATTSAPRGLALTAATNGLDQADPRGSRRHV